MKMIFGEMGNTCDIFQDRLYLGFDFYHPKTLHSHEQTRSMFEVCTIVT